ncbi:MAG: DUF2974 domain-containing protein [Clostridia bacterium]|nr:DUF2974 domain-containing protein [Clostridia bacterium]
MANMMAYLLWRGDLSMKTVPFNEVDNLIFTQLCYFNFDEVMEENEVCTLYELEKRFFQKYDKSTFSLGLFFPPEINELLSVAAASKRFGNVKVTRPVNLLDREKKIQFGAVTFLLEDKSFYCAFRGTDDYILSWYESFSLGVYDELPIHALAKDYLAASVKRYRFRRFRVGGHSKGGHLSQYAAMKLDKRAQKRLITVYNNDGPGFRYDITADEGFRRIEDRLVLVTPYMSMVGAMLNHSRAGDILASDGEGAFQHSAFNWHVTHDSFVRLPQRSKESVLFEASLKNWLGKIDDSEKERFLIAMYQLLSASGAETLSEISEDRINSALSLGKTLLSFDKETRDLVSRAVLLFLRERRTVLKKTKDAEKQFKKSKKTPGKEDDSSSPDGVS